MTDPYWDGYDKGQENANNDSPAAGGYNQAMDEVGTSFFTFFGDDANSELNGLRDGFSDGVEGKHR